MYEIIENKLLPQALMIGVSYEQFWTLNPKTLSPFIKAFELKEKHLDEVMWNMGDYIRLAVGSVLSKECRYPTKPNRSMVAITEKSQQDRIKEKFILNANLINRKFGGELIENKS